MDDRIRASFQHGHLIDITTIGRRTGTPRRIEIVFHNMDGRLIISGMPVPGRTRAWITNVEADPRLTVHLKGAVQADLPATGRVVTDEAERRAIAEWIVTNAWPKQDVKLMAAHAPMLEVSIQELAA